MLLALVGLMAAVPLCAQAFPNRPVRIVVPYPPGGTNDIAPRVLSPVMAQELGQNIIVDNRPGGNTLIGADIVAKSMPDGHTMLVVAAGHALLPALYPRLPFDASRDFAPVSLLGSSAYMLVVHPSTGVSSVKELIGLAGQKPGKIVYASSSTGNLTHLAAELFGSLAGVKMLHVPYKGGNAAVSDLVAGRVAMFFASVAVGRSHVEAGRIRALGVTTSRRSQAVPDIPTIAEAGLPGYEVNGWYGLIAAAGTPTPVIARLHRAIQKGLGQPAIREKFMSIGVEVSDGVLPGEFGKLIDTDIAKWNKVAKPLQISMD
jgi:tripartite-type tricarboxylate transporter receptor subunit TctC